ncbi:MAG: 30S ribosomal protein S3 [archaeon]
MEEKKFVDFKKNEFNVKEFIKKSLGKGRISSVKIEYTPVGEKIIISTSKPGFVIGRKGEKINEITNVIKAKFKLENPHIEILEITRPEFDAQTMADEIALSLEKLGNLRFKIIAYKALERIMKAGALGVEIKLSGRLPSERSRSWRFTSGYLKKTGDTAKIVSRAKATALTQPGISGVKVAILPPDAKIHDQIKVTDELKSKIRARKIELDESKQEKPKKKTKKKETKIKEEELKSDGSAKE